MHIKYIISYDYKRKIILFVLLVGALLTFYYNLKYYVEYKTVPKPCTGALFVILGWKSLTNIKLHRGRVSTIGGAVQVVL